MKHAMILAVLLLAACGRPEGVPVSAPHETIPPSPSESKIETNTIPREKMPRVGECAVVRFNIRGVHQTIICNNGTYGHTVSALN